MKVAAVALVAAAALLDAASVHAQGSWLDINPDRSTLHSTDPDGASGGRVNGLGRTNDATALYAATEMGGLYRSNDSGRTWRHIPSHVPMVMWDVEVDPANSNRIYATSFYDGKVQSLAGISVSNDNGQTWSNPPTSRPPVGFCSEERRTQPSAFGIFIPRETPNRVFIGTNCGLAISLDGGQTWTFRDPSTEDDAHDVWDVVVHHNGIIDICGEDGHRRSTNGGQSWTTTSDLPGGRCSIAASPDEASVLFTVVGYSIRESDDGGVTWQEIVNPTPQGRIPFVAVNDRAGPAFDLWFGDVRLNRASCTSATTAAAGPRCPVNAWSEAYTRGAGAHDDAGDILFDPGAVDACPILFSSDGGVYWNTRRSSPDCHAPLWTQPDFTPHALRLYAMTGVPRPGAGSEELYLGLQDNGSFASTNAGNPMITWFNRDCCDVHSIAAEQGRVLSSYSGVNIYSRNSGMDGGSFIPNMPPGNLIAFRYPDAIVNFGPSSYAAVTSSGVFITTDAGATAWTPLGGASTPDLARNIRVGMNGATPTFFVQRGDGNGQTVDEIWRFVGTGAGQWQRVNPPGGVGGFGVFAVDPVNPNRLFAAHLQTSADPAMVMSTDGGVTWNPLLMLDTLMTGRGRFLYRNTRGPAPYSNSVTPSFNGYPMPTLVAFDPGDSRVMVAGGAESGVFLSLNAGVTWELITDPYTPGTSPVPHLPRPVFAYINHDPEAAGMLPQLNLYIGTDGRGVWRYSRP